MCLLEWFSDLGPNDSFVLTTRCGSQGTPTHSSLSSPCFLWLTLLFWTALNFLWFPLPPPESFSFFNHRSIHAWIEIVKSALNTRSKISAKSYQFHGSKNNSINLYFLKDTRIPWPRYKLHCPWNNFPDIWWLRSHIKVLLRICQVNDYHL